MHYVIFLCGHSIFYRFPFSSVASRLFKTCFLRILRLLICSNLCFLYLYRRLFSLFLSFSEEEFARSYWWRMQVRSLEIWSDRISGLQDFKALNFTWYPDNPVSDGHFWRLTLTTLNKILLYYIFLIIENNIFFCFSPGWEQIFEKSVIYANCRASFMTSSFTGRLNFQMLPLRALKQRVLDADMMHSSQDPFFLS